MAHAPRPSTSTEAYASHPSASSQHHRLFTVAQTTDGRTVQVKHPDHETPLQCTGPLRRSLLTASSSELKLLSDVACNSPSVQRAIQARNIRLPPLYISTPSTSVSASGPRNRNQSTQQLPSFNAGFGQLVDVTGVQTKRSAPRENMERESKRPRSTSSSGSPLPSSVAVDDLQVLDWEYVVKMYLTGEGTVDGMPLRDMKRGNGRGNGSNRDSVTQERNVDRKKLEKQRTVGKTFSLLGRERFERCIGYRYDESGSRKKQRMYQVIARCRVISGMKKQGEAIPDDAEELTALIDHRLNRKEAAKRSQG